MVLTGFENSPYVTSTFQDRAFPRSAFADSSPGSGDRFGDEGLLSLVGGAIPCREGDRQLGPHGSFDGGGRIRRRKTPEECSAQENREPICEAPLLGSAVVVGKSAVRGV